MIRTLRSTSRWCAAFLLAGLSLACTKQADAVEASRNDNARQLATQLLAAGNTTGGLIVHVGCGDGRLTAALRAGEGYLVHGLDTHADRVAEARARIRNLGSYGDVSVDTFDGKHLPYGRDTVNLLVASGMYQVPQEEMTRVLAPGGVLLARSSCLEARQWPDLTPSSAGLKGWSTFIKPRPADIDQWSHFLHDAGGNAVAADKQVGPPQRLRWVAGPRWCRSHEMPTSVNAVVTAGGRLFTIFDEGPTGVYEKMPWRCHLIARDAANGVQLWKVPMRGWQPEFGTGRGNRWHIHHTIPRRLVADGDRVYVTLGFLDSPISVLDAATGEVLIEGLKGTRGADEIILSDGVLITKITESRSVGATERINRSAKNDTLAAVDVATGEPLWRNDGVCVVPYALSAQAGRVVYHNLEELVCLDARTGDEIWRAPNRIGATVGAASTLVLCDGVVLFHGHMQQTTDNSNQKRRRELYLTALSLEDGKLLWKRKGGKGQAGACTQPTDLFVIDGTVWCDGSTEGYELSTGKVARTLSLGKLISPGHHYRCHRSKATERFLIWPKRGAEFIDLEGEDHMRHDWVRAPCFTGATPANGLLYMPSSQCFCYPGVKIPGYLAMSAQAAEPL
ncbi:MAG: PQQ-binding-like beta-propeller repeat protein, partial [Planctomycetota bacterium]